MHYLCSMSVHMTCVVGLVTSASKRYSACVGCLTGPWTLFYLNVAELPSHNCALFVLLLCIQICACACTFAWVLNARTSNKAWSHASYSIQQLLCKMLMWKSKCRVYARVNKRLRATTCSCGYRDMAEFGIWLLLRPQMEILFDVVSLNHPLYLLLFIVRFTSFCEAGTEPGQRWGTTLLALM